MLTPEQLKKIIALLKEEDGEGALKFLEEIAAGAPAEETPDDPTAASSDSPPTEEEQAMTALSREVVTLTGASNAGEALSRVKSIVSAHAETEKRARALESSERRGLVAKLVQLGAETPATAWVSVDAEGDAREPVKRLADEPIAELRSRVEALAAANPGRVRIEPPKSKAAPVKQYSRSAIKFMKQEGLTPEEFEARKASAVRRSAH